MNSQSVVWVMRGWCASFHSTRFSTQSYQLLSHVAARMFYALSVQHGVLEVRRNAQKRQPTHHNMGVRCGVHFTHYMNSSLKVIVK